MTDDAAPVTTPSDRPRDVDADAVAAAVTACPSVVRLLGGPVGAQVATLLPGRRVEGVRVTADAVEVHIASRWGVPIPEVAAEVRLAAAPLVGARTITVAVDDIDEPLAALPAGSPDAVESPEEGAEARTLPPDGGAVAVPSPS